MVETPSDKIDKEDYENPTEYIEDAMEEGWTLEAEDFEGRRCAYCGEVLPFVDWPDGVETWDTPVLEPDSLEREPYVQRDYFCSEECIREARTDSHWLQSAHNRYDEGDRIHVDDLEGNR